MAITNGVPMVNGVTYGWADIIVLIGGVPVTGISAIEYGDKQDIANKYGAGRHPVSRGKGRITPSAKITLEMGEVLSIQSRALNGRLQDIEPFDVQVSYIPDSGIIVHDVIHGCQFTENKRGWKEGDTAQDVDLELLPSHIEWNSKF